jgi:hypothetical protein
VRCCRTRSTRRKAPIDHAWLRLQLAGTNQELANLDKARRAATRLPAARSNARVETLALRIAHLPCTPMTLGARVESKVGSKGLDKNAALSMSEHAVCPGGRCRRQVYKRDWVMQRG